MLSIIVRVESAVQQALGGPSYWLYLLFLVITNSITHYNKWHKQLVTLINVQKSDRVQKVSYC